MSLSNYAEILEAADRYRAARRAYLEAVERQGEAAQAAEEARAASYRAEAEYQGAREALLATAAPS